MKPDVINGIGNASGAAAVTSGTVGFFAENYSQISLGISFATLLVFLLFKWLHYQLAKKRHDKDKN